MGDGDTDKTGRNNSARRRRGMGSGEKVGAEQALVRLSLLL